MTFEQVNARWLGLSNESAELEDQLNTITSKLSTLESDLSTASEGKYEVIALPEGGSRVASLETLKKEMVELVGMSYEAKGKTKDERAADLIRFVRENYKEYDEYENRIQLADQQIRNIKSDIAAQERQLTGVSKRLSQIRVRLEGLNKLFGYFTAQLDESKRREVLTIEQHMMDELNEIKAAMTAQSALDAAKRDAMQTFMEAMK